MANVRISIDEIPLGATCGSAIQGEDGRVLLSAGVVLTEDFLNRLRTKGISHVLVSEDWDRSSSEGAKQSQESDSGDDPRSSSVKVDRAGEAYDKERTERFAKQVDSAVALIDRFGMEGDFGDPQKRQELCQIPDALAKMLVEDSDQSIASTDPKVDTKLGDRCTRMSMLAMSTAMEMGLSKADISHVGLAGLLHDMGLYRLPAKMRDPATTLSFEELYTYRTHPRISMDLLEDFNGISEVVRLLIGQVHELPDGSGYPRGLRKHRLHALTRILNAIEVYLALTSAGPGRPAVIAHDALTFMLFQCQNGTLDADVMRAFTNQMALYPIGSLVELDNGTQARVVRRDGDNYDTPNVLPVGAGPDELIVLARSDRKISKPVCNPNTEMRIDKPLMAELTLHSLLSTTESAASYS